MKKQDDEKQIFDEFLRDLDYQPIGSFNCAGEVRWHRTIGRTVIRGSDFENVGPMQVPDKLAAELRAFLARLPADWQIEVDGDPLDPQKLVLRIVPTPH